MKRPASARTVAKAKGKTTTKGNGNDKGKGKGKAKSKGCFGSPKQAKDKGNGVEANAAMRKTLRKTVGKAIATCARARLAVDKGKANGNGKGEDKGNGKGKGKGKSDDDDDAAARVAIQAEADAFTESDIEALVFEARTRQLERQGLSPLDAVAFITKQDERDRAENLD